MVWILGDNKMENNWTYKKVMKMMSMGKISYEKLEIRIALMMIYAILAVAIEINKLKNELKNK